MTCSRAFSVTSLLVGMVLGAFAALSSASAAPLTLTGNYLQVGISDYGTFGSDGSTEPGLLHDPNGTGNFRPGGIPNDYLTPGTPHDGFAVYSNETGLITNDNSGTSGFGTAPPTLLTGAAAKGYDNAANSTITYSSFLTISNSYYFNKDDEQVKVVTIITALANLTNVSFGRSEDPDPDLNQYGTFDTVNTRGDATTAPADLVSAAGQYTGLTLGILNQSGNTYPHNTEISSFCCSNDDPRNVLANTDTLAYPATNVGDYGLQIAWALGDLAAGQSKEIDYSYVFGTHQGSVATSGTTVIGTTGGDVAANVFSLGSPAAQAGTVAFDGGTLQMSGGTFTNNVITAPVTISANNGTIDTSTGNGGFSGVVSGPGGLTIMGGGTFTLSAANTYAGGTVVNASTVAIGNATALGTGTLTLAGGTLQAAADNLSIANAAVLTGNGTIDTQAFGLTYTGAISGTGSLTKLGSGTLTLPGANTYAGGTMLQAGTLAVGDSAALGTGTLTFAGGTLQAGADALTIVNAAVLASNGTVDTRGFGLTYAGAISGAGQLTKVGSGTLTLPGANTYAGGTMLQAGTLAAGDGAALGTGTLTFAGGTLQAGADALIIGNAAVLASDGTIDTQAFGLTYTGAISGTGSLTKLGSGTLTLAGADTASGRTTVTAGTLRAGIANALSSASALTVATGAMVDLGGFNQAIGSLAGGGTVLNNGAGAVLSIGADGTSTTFSGLLADGSGPLAVAKTGSGTLTLSGANTFSGGTALNGGILAVGNNAALGTGGLTFGGGTLQAAADGLTIGNAAVLASNGTIDTGSFTLTYAGVISGAASLTKIGTGTLTLTGANTFSGGARLDAGTVSIANGAALGTGAITFAGGTLRPTVDGLTVRNAAVLTGSGTIDTGSFGLTYAGALSGTGSFTKAGSGTLTLAGADTATGPTLVNAGTLQAGAPNALSASSALTVAGGATLDLNAFNQAVGSLAGSGTVLNNGKSGATLTAGRDESSTTFSGVLKDGNGPLALAKAGAGTLSLAGASSYTGGTALLAGTLAIGNSGALGTGSLSMDDGTTLLFTAADLTLANAIVFTGVADPTIDTGASSETISGPISGAGALTKQGSGTLDLTGTNTYTGATTVAAGTLLVDGSTASSVVTVANGATLGGVGTIGGLVAQSGALVTPGRDVTYGTLTVAGNATFASGSTFQVTINGDGRSDRLAVTGTATLGGAAVNVLAGTGPFDPSASYTLLTAAGGVSGTFGSLTAPSDDLAFLNPVLGYDADDVTLSFKRNSVVFASLAATPDQRAAASAIQALGPNSPLYDAVVIQTDAGTRAAFGATSGVSHASTSSTTTVTSHVVGTAVIDRLWDTGGSGLDAQQLLDKLAPDSLPALVRCYGPVPETAAPASLIPAGLTAWGEGFGSFGHIDGGANASISDTLGGFVLGLDAPVQGVLGDKWRVGVAGGYTQDHFTSKPDGANGTVQGIFGSVYGGARYGAIDIRLGSTFSSTSNDNHRTVAFPGFLEREHSSNDGYAVQGFGEIGYRFPANRFVVEPVAGLSVVAVHQNAFSETGGAAALNGAAQDNMIETTTLGVRGEVAPFAGIPLVAHGFLGWQHAFGDLNPLSILAFKAAPANSFAVTGTPIDTDALATEASLDWRATSAVSLGLSYTGQYGTRAENNSVKGRVEYRF